MRACVRACVLACLRVSTLRAVHIRGLADINSPPPPPPIDRSLHPFIHLTIDQTAQTEQGGVGGNGGGGRTTPRSRLLSEDAFSKLECVHPHACSRKHCLPSPTQGLRMTHIQ